MPNSSVTDFQAAWVFPAAFLFSDLADRSHNARVIDVVCGVIRDKTGRYLACQRPQGKHLGGLWEFPGGKVEAGESPEIAVARELEEELGISVKVGEALSPVVFAYDSVTIRLLPFVCEILSGNLHPHEHQALEWCAVEDFGKLKWAEADVPILREIESLRIFNH